MAGRRLARQQSVAECQLLWPVWRRRYQQIAMSEGAAAAVTTAGFVETGVTVAASVATGVSAKAVKNKNPEAARMKRSPLTPDLPVPRNPPLSGITVLTSMALPVSSVKGLGNRSPGISSATGSVISESEAVDYMARARRAGCR